MIRRLFFSTLFTVGMLTGLLLAADRAMRGQSPAQVVIPLAGGAACVWLVVKLQE